MIKSILFPVLAGGLQRRRIAAACELAREHDAHLVAVICISAVTPVAAAWSAYPMAVYDTLSEARRRRVPRSRGTHRQAGPAGVSHEVHVSDTLWMTTSEIAAVHARYCDITVFGRVPGAEARLESGFFSDLLLHSGRPLLLVPATPGARAPHTAVIAWKPTREAARAFHDALPLLAPTWSIPRRRPGIGDLDMENCPAPISPRI